MAARSWPAKTSTCWPNITLAAACVGLGAATTLLKDSPTVKKMAFSHDKTMYWRALLSSALTVSLGTKKAGVVLFPPDVLCRPHPVQKRLSAGESGWEWVCACSVLCTLLFYSLLDSSERNIHLPGVLAKGDGWISGLDQGCDEGLHHVIISFVGALSILLLAFKLLRTLLTVVGMATSTMWPP